jgi:predicted amidophosphoribosyltransferase
MSLRSSSAERLLSPRHGPGACPRCLNLTGTDGLCRACGANEPRLAAVVPISYSVGGEWLHHLIASYKRDADPSVPDALAMLAGLCEDFLGGHELCVAAASGVPEFELVTTVPSADPMRDLHHPLRRLAGELVLLTRHRYERLLVRSDTPAIARVFDPARYRPTRPLNGETILLIDDMWTSGASAESAAAALRADGAGPVALVVIARHLNRSWHRNDERLARLAHEGFDTDHCVLCARSAA